MSSWNESDPEARADFGPAEDVDHADSEGSDGATEGFYPGCDGVVHDAEDHDWESCPFCVKKAQDDGMLGPDAVAFGPYDPVGDGYALDDPKRHGPGGRWDW